MAFSAVVGASHRLLARAGDRWLVQTNGRTAFVDGVAESGLHTQIPEEPLSLTVLPVQKLLAT
jgi:hypothetical protein